MFIKADKRTWIEVPDNATDELKRAKIDKYNKEQEQSIIKLKTHSYTSKTTYKANVGALYDKRINLAGILNNLR